MALEMRGTCKKCDAALSWGGEAFICSYECTYCTPCSDEMDYLCPNCGGELLGRPRRSSNGG